MKSYQSICQAFPRKTYFEIRGFSLALANLVNSCLICKIHKVLPPNCHTNYSKGYASFGIMLFLVSANIILRLIAKWHYEVRAIVTILSRRVQTTIHISRMCVCLCDICKCVHTYILCIYARVCREIPAITKTKAHVREQPPQ